MTQLPAAALAYLLTALGIYMVSDGTPSQTHDVTAVTVAHCTGDERKQVPDGLQDQGRPGGGNKGVLHQDKAGAKSLIYLPSETCRRFAMISCLPISKLVSPCFKSRPLPRFRCARRPLQARPLTKRRRLRRTPLPPPAGRSPCPGGVVTTCTKAHLPLEFAGTCWP